jgi:tripartite-type tricarboxylate transporter receptor subunit TctC
MRNRRQFLTSVSLAVATVAIAAALPSPVHAQADWPQRPVTLIVPFAAGGNTDGIARMTAERLSNAFGKSFVVENRPGAGGAIAAEMVSKAAPDGHTLFIAALPVMAIVPAINKVRYDPIKNFQPISNIATNPFVIVVNKDIPVKNLKEFVDYVAARKGQLSYGSAGIGSLNHLSMALFLKKAGLDMTHVPYKGNAPALADVVAGHIPAMFSNFSDALPQAKAGNVRMIALSSDKRNPARSGGSDGCGVRLSGFLRPHLERLDRSGEHANADRGEDRRRNLRRRQRSEICRTSPRFRRGPAGQLARGLHRDARARRCDLG